MVTFPVPIKNEVANGKEEEDDGGKKEKEEDDDSKEEEEEEKKDDNSKKKRITYKLKFNDSYRFMQSKLSDLIDNLYGINNKECKSCIKRKKKSNQYAILLGFKIIV